MGRIKKKSKAARNRRKPAAAVPTPVPASAPAAAAPRKTRKTAASAPSPTSPARRNTRKAAAPDTAASASAPATPASAPVAAASRKKRKMNSGDAEPIQPLPPPAPSSLGCGCACHCGAAAAATVGAAAAPSSRPSTAQSTPRNQSNNTSNKKVALTADEHRTLRSLLDVLNGAAPKKESDCTDSSPYGVYRLAALAFYAVLRLDGAPDLDVRYRVAGALWGRDRLRTKVDSFPAWIAEVMETGTLALTNRGKNQPLCSVIQDEDLKQELRVYLRSESKLLTAQSFTTFLNTVFLTRDDVVSCFGETTVSKRTTSRWLNELGWSWSLLRKGIYTDGHDSVAARASRIGFLDKHDSFAEFMETLGEKEDADGVLPLVPPTNSARRIVAMYHDEMTFMSNDGVRNAWTENGTSSFYQKSAGKGIMVSAFLCQCHGLMYIKAATKGDDDFHAHVLFEYGANGQGYWKTDHLVGQIKERVFKVFEALHPGADALFVFDNATSHKAFAADTLIASKVRLRDGGKYVPMRDGWYINEDGVRVVQKMVVDGKNRGAQSILKERGLWPSAAEIKDNYGGSFLYKCKDCQLSAIKDPNRESRTACCALCLLASQRDFLEQDGSVAKAIKAYRSVAHPNVWHEVLFLPKFHPELNRTSRSGPLCVPRGAANLRYRFSRACSDRARVGSGQGRSAAVVRVLHPRAAQERTEGARQRGYRHDSQVLPQGLALPLDLSAHGKRRPRRLHRDQVQVAPPCWRERPQDASGRARRDHGPH